MSAIFGILNRHGAPVDSGLGETMQEALSAYPADDSRLWSEGRVLLGCHAQWITPESVSEKLPLVDETRGLALTSDAILDNREELFDRLGVEAQRRAAMTDSELILLAYERWGTDCPNFLVGDFAFMVWDRRRSRLFGARDFSGNRTLYYHADPRMFSFCTAIRPLLGLPGAGRGLNESWVAEFLAHPGMVDTVDAASTVYDKVAQVPPSHSITVTEDRIDIRRYCTVWTGERLNMRSDGEYEEAFRDVFGQAVKARLRARRGVGAYLSGGLDSGAVAGFAAGALREAGKPLYTYSYIPAGGFVDWTPKSRIPDERPYIQSVVRHVGNIQDRYLDFEGRSAVTEIDDMLQTLEMPYKFFENSFWIKGIYETASEQGLSVLLNGARGNFTVSWGPALDYYASLVRKLRWIRLYREMKQYSLNQGVGRSKILPAVGVKAFPFLLCFRREESKAAYPLLVHPDLAERTGAIRKLKEHGVNLEGFTKPNANLFKLRRQMFEQFYAWNMNGNSITKLSLRHALWNRDPTNDLRVIRFCLAVPEEQFVRGGRDRALIRRSTAKVLPDSVRLNQRVRGIQGADAIHRMEPSWKAVTDEVRELCMDPALSGWINVPAVQEALERFRDTPKPEDSYHFQLKILIRSLIFYRFMKKHA